MYGKGLPQPAAGKGFGKGKTGSISELGPRDQNLGMGQQGDDEMTSDGDQTSMSQELTMQLTKELVENADLRNSIKDMVMAEMGSMADIGSAKKEVERLNDMLAAEKKEKTEIIEQALTRMLNEQKEIAKKSQAELKLSREQLVEGRTLLAGAQDQLSKYKPHLEASGGTMREVDGVLYLTEGGIISFFGQSSTAAMPMANLVSVIKKLGVGPITEQSDLDLFRNALAGKTQEELKDLFGDNQADDLMESQGAPQGQMLQEQAQASAQAQPAPQGPVQYFMNMVPEAWKHRPLEARTQLRKAQCPILLNEGGREAWPCFRFVIFTDLRDGWEQKCVLWDRFPLNKSSHCFGIIFFPWFIFVSSCIQMTLYLSRVCFPQVKVCGASILFVKCPLLELTPWLRSLVKDWDGPPDPEYDWGCMHC